MGGISTGKSFVGVYDLLMRAKAGRTYMVIGPTYTSLRDSSLKSFLSVARDIGMLDPKHLKLAAPPELKLLTGATILFRSADNPELLRGPNLSGVLLDEASIMPKAAYEIAIGRLREAGDQDCWLSACFTPKGPSHWTYDTFTARSQDVELIRARTADNPFNPPGFATILRRNYTESFAKQELDGEFVAMEGAIFPPEWFDFPDFFVPEWPAQGVVCEVVYLDPSQGKDAKAGDYQAYVRAGLWPGPKNENRIYLECHANKEPPPDMVARGVRMCRERRPHVWAYETNGTMGLLAQEIARQLGAAQYPLPTLPVTNTEPKRWRIRSALMKYLHERRIRIVDTPGGRLLRAQLGDEPFADHDDCSDAAAGAVTVLGNMLAGR